MCPTAFNTLTGSPKSPKHLCGVIRHPNINHLTPILLRVQQPWKIPRDYMDAQPGAEGRGLSSIAL